jgi:phage-related protein
VADVIARAAVEIIPDVELFARELLTKVKTFSRDIEKSLGNVDKKISKLGQGGGGGDPFKRLTGDINDDLNSVSDKIDKTNTKIVNWFDDTQQHVVVATRRAANGIEQVITRLPTAAEKASRDVKREVDKIGDAVDKVNKDASKSSDDVDGSFRRLNERLVGVATSLGKVVSIGTSVTSLLPIVASLGQLLATAAQAAALLPGALATIGAAGLVAKLAFTGVADAIKETDPKKLAEEMKKLAPPAQEFVKAVRKLKDEFDGVIQGIQGAFFKGLDHKIDALAKLFLPALTHGLVDISTELNKVARNFIDVLISADSLGAVRSIMDSTVTVVHNLGAAFGPVLEALLDIADVGANVFAGLTSGAEKAAIKFRDFIAQAKESGKLKEFMLDGVDALKALWSILKDIVGIVGNIFRPLIEGTGELQTPLTELIKTFREFTASTGFVDFMRTLAGIFKQLGDAIGTVFKAALDALLPVLSEVLSKLSDHMAKIIPDLVPALVNLIGFFGDLLMALVPLLDPIFKLAQTLLPPLADVLRRVIESIDMDKLTQLVEVISNSLVKAIEDLAPKIADLAEKLGDILVKLGPLISTFADFTVNVAPPLIDGIILITGVILSLINIAITPLVDAWNALSKVVPFVWDQIKNATGVFVDSLKLTFNEGLVPLVKGIADIFGNIRDSIRDKFQEALQYVRDIPNKIRDSFGDVGRILFDAGAKFISGFIDGIKAKIQDAKNAIGQAMSSMRALFPFSPAKEGPFSGRGYVTFSGESMIRDFAKSLSDDSAVRRAVQGLMQATQSEFARSSPTNVGNFTTRATGGTSGDVARRMAESAARSADAGSAVVDGSVDVQVFIGEQELTSLVTNVVSDRDRRVKRAVTAGGRRVP